ncbi:hypothetical protein [Tessaracoccus caeni]|uniref:hypothetical protein n=1 Tax=Tessaracoccus caeni TaxID=3031239 RepID=UPI0023DA7B4C|nr:hypothetical protein [Tessaracoccus caeni]MDF1488840.1 hypothetical protein [Tessaracoccus caeni]
MSEKHPAATREDHDRFCEIEGWVLTRGATGRPVQHHRTYELALWDGRILRTRISRPVDRTEYGASMWSHILRNQLDVTATEFWACVKHKTLPDRGGAPAPAVKKAVPLYLLRALRDLGVPEQEILTLGAADAASLHAKLLAEQQDT